MKEHLFYVFLFIFSATALLTLAGIAKWIRIDDFYLKRLCGVLLLELSVAVTGTYSRTDFFAAPTLTAAPSAPSAPSATAAANPRGLIPHLQTPRALLDYLRAEEAKRPALENIHNAVATRVVGCAVDWELEVSDVVQAGCNTAQVIASAPDTYADICSGPLCVWRNPDVRLAARGSKIKMRGIIASIDPPLSIVLTDTAVTSVQ
ncbi:hypothetical protein [Herbaspirillum autotrophicum]|uniref:hypothetical protein n=1 Tax=Herbaspirillum autotrophicum TaxID=180195 RepID=UPI00067B1EB3|nr:hypothetical protein [Herbaspirillum autotrophicum]